jgi:hypothetical protein
VDLHRYTCGKPCRSLTHRSGFFYSTGHHRSRFKV